jgi:hypothetical protein
MPRIDITELRRECQRILAYTEGLTTDALRRDTSLGDAIFLRVQRLYDLAAAALNPGDDAVVAAPGPHLPPRADSEQLRAELAAAQARIAELETDKKAGHAKKRHPAAPPAVAPPTPLHLRVVPTPPPLPPEDENMTFLGLAKK